MNDELCTFLTWDTEFFGRRIARLNHTRLDQTTLAAMDSWCREQAIDCLYFNADADHPETIRLAEAGGFNLVEVRLVFERHLHDWDPQQRPRAGAEICVRPATIDDLPAVQAIAEGSYVDSRFYFDQNFSPAQWAAYYRTWVQNSLNGRAELALVAEQDGQVVGYITGRPAEDRQELMYELTGVNPAARRSGVGQELFRSGMDWCVQHGIPTIWLATQGRNVPTQRMVQRNGFITRTCSLYYHRWFNSQNI